MTKKQQIVQFLKKKGVFDQIDQTLIDEFVFNLQLMKKAKKEIRDNGLMLNVVRTPGKDPYYQPNPAIKIYDQALKSVKDISRVLGITVVERQRMKLEEAENDGFNE